MLGGVVFFRSRGTRLQKAVFKVRQSFTGHGRLVILLTKLARELLRRGAGARTSVNADKTKKQGRPEPETCLGSCRLSGAELILSLIHIFFVGRLIDRYYCLGRYLCELCLR